LFPVQLWEWLQSIWTATRLGSHAPATKYLIEMSRPGHESPWERIGKFEWRGDKKVRVAWRRPNCITASREWLRASRARDAYAWSYRPRTATTPVQTQKRITSIAFLGFFGSHRIAASSAKTRNRRQSGVWNRTTPTWAHHVCVPSIAPQAPDAS
jgi:hypothetical protein